MKLTAKKCKYFKVTHGSLQLFIRASMSIWISTRSRPAIHLQYTPSHIEFYRRRGKSNMLRNGIFEPSPSPWSSCVVLWRKRSRWGGTSLRRLSEAKLYHEARSVSTVLDWLRWQSSRLCSLLWCPEPDIGRLACTWRTSRIRFVHLEAPVQADLIRTRECSQAYVLRSRLPTQGLLGYFGGCYNARS